MPKIARKHNLTSVCVESLSKIYTIASVPIVDCFQKIRQQVKCYVQTAATLGKNELQEGLDVIESTNLKYFTKQMTAEFLKKMSRILTEKQLTSAVMYKDVRPIVHSRHAHSKK